MNFHDKRVHPAFLLLTSFLILISYRIISDIIAQNAETGRVGQGQVAMDIMSCVFHEMRNAIKCTNTLCRLRNKYSAYIRFTAVKSVFYRYPYFLSGQDWG